MQHAEKALKSLEDFESVKEEAIKELLAAKEDIETKLARLGCNGQSSRKVASKRRKPCRVCGSQEHDARFHRRKPKELQRAPE